MFILNSEATWHGYHPVHFICYTVRNNEIKYAERLTQLALVTLAFTRQYSYGLMKNLCRGCSLQNCHHHYYTQNCERTTLALLRQCTASYAKAPQLWQYFTMHIHEDKTPQYITCVCVCVNNRCTYTLFQKKTGRLKQLGKTSPK